MSSARRIGDRYQLDSVLGEGGCAVVYRAHDQVLDVPRAVKLLTSLGPRREAARERLHAEARAMALLEHPHVLRVYDVVSDGTTDCIVMELAPHGSLADQLDRDGPIAPKRALTFVRDVLSALEAAHQAGIIHRDVKPQNVLLNDRGEALLADFGIALITLNDLRMTRTGAAVGSLSYMAPEQRLDARSVGPGADIYGVAATLYVLLTLGNPVDLFTAKLDSPRLAMLPPPLLDIIWRGSRFAPEDRYASAQEMRRAVEAALVNADATPLLAAPGHVSPEAPRGARTTGTLHASRRDVGEPVQRKPKRAYWLLLPVLLLGLGWLALSLSPAPTSVPTASAPPPPSTPMVVVAPPDAPQPSAAEPPAPPSTAAADTIQEPTASQSGAPSAIAGQWSGSWDGRPLSVTLDGTDDALRGQVVVTFMNNAVRSRVRGSVNNNGELTLVDVLSTPDAGSYSATLSPDGQRLYGHFTGRTTGRIIQFSLRRP